ncbi:malonic semialdehyde reductase [Marinitenerispora sediminis]|uniref:Malonic semialdehyde reductase n=1 Tax=Marinitenerispora sediminis TaxID=1931232 RepID=A0A368T879_9ACTN|nr:malonic semialdehyde reductase [Marinitenerispora sediminis]RCV54326.1 malonic semialdehyde reductase [Marinitenerispora sediminis]RCV60500.1 malonic semialdehyde reductase [Marinitenerispora sediminis]RCV61052.1 malonic semialdehyde reductase [Marinitenerispora sediminis]
MPHVTEPLSLDAEAQDLLFREARTANTFTDEPVTEEQVRAIHGLVKYGPTALNSQPLRVVLLRSAESRERLVRHMAEGNRAKTRTAPLTAILAVDTDFHEKADTFFPDRAERIRESFADPAVRQEKGTFNAALQAGYFIIAVRAAGLAAGPMTGYDSEAVDKEFFTDGRYKTVLVVNIGRPGPDAWFPRRLPRLGYDEVVSEL